MKIMKKLALIFSVLVLVVLLAAVLIPVLFKGRLVEMARRQINENVNATVEFGDVGLSFLRSFPDITLCVEDFAVTGVDRFQGVPLMSGRRLDLTLQFWSVVRSNSPIQLKSVSLEEPVVNILVLRDGSANYDIARGSGEESAAEAQSNMEIRLDRYRISDGLLVYDDHSLDTYIRAAHLNHAGSGNFTLSVFDLDTETSIDSLTVRQGGISYLSGARVLLDALFNIDNVDSKYTLKDNQLTVNDFQLQGEGFVQLAGDDINLDLSLQAPSNAFKDLWSLIPNAYVQDYASVQADGQFRFDGRINGTYNGDREQYPAFDFNLQIENGRVKYPDLPLAISDINGRGNVKSPGSDFDELVVDVPEFRVRIGDSPFQARFRLTTPISDPDLDAAVKGVIDLAALSQAYPMEGMEALAGIIRADVEARTKLSYIENKEYERVVMKGALDIEKLGYQADPYPPVFINSAEMTFTPAAVNLSSFDGKFGESDLKASGKINNFLAYFSPEKTMTGDLTLESRHFDINEWYSDDEEVVDTVAVAESGEEELFTRFDFNVDAEAAEMIYDRYRLLNTRARGRVAPNRIELQEGYTRIGDSDFSFSGTITNGYEYVYSDGILGGRLKLRSGFLNLNEFMETEDATAATSEEALEPILVPGNIAMTIDADIDRLQYTNLELRNLKGALSIEDETVVLEDVQASTLGGNIRFSGGYDTRDAENPAFNFKYDIAKMDFQKAFTALNTFQAIAPIGKFINGNFNTSLIMSGVLGANMMPRLSSLNAEGFLETLNGVIKNFKPLQAVGQQLNIQYLTDDWQIVNTRNWFEVKDGFVEVKDFDTRIKDIPMVIGGRHGLNQDMDYHIRASIPRKLLERSSVGQAANTGLNLLTEQASRLGVNIRQGENVNVQVNLTGSITQPKVGVKFLGMDGETSLADAAKSQLEAEAQKQLEEGKKLAEEKAGQFLASFEKVREFFIDVFRSLFTIDDSCDLILLEPENPLESKIEIVARPKGKRPQTISQLSGGEKTLTATALLFALYLLKPAPFCIFDEVDAPLDDANIYKFNKIIKKFSHDSQFIIVTHNKLTMAAVDTIYGVYMAEQGVSGVSQVDFRDFDHMTTFEISRQ